MEHLDRKEIVWGGTFGIISILAAFAEMLINGINAASIAGTIKDIFGTAVVVVLLVELFKSLPHKPKNLVQILEETVEDWGQDNTPLIFKTEGYVAAQGKPFTQGFVLLQNPRNYVSLCNMGLNKTHPDWMKYAKYGSRTQTGKFLDMSSYEAMTRDAFILEVTMEQSHFKNMPEISSIIKDITTAISSSPNHTVTATQVGNSQTIRLNCQKISSVEDATNFVDMLDFLLSMVKVIA